MFTSAMTITRADLVRVLLATEFQGQPLQADDFDILPDYYDRDGHRCFAVALPYSRDLRHAFFKTAFRLLGEETADKLARKSRVDSLNLDMILHFPGVTLAEAAA